MKWISIAALTAALVLIPVKVAAATLNDKASGVVAVCGSRSSSDQLLCIGYVRGLTAATVNIYQTLPDDLKSCPPSSVTYGEIMTVYLSAARLVRQDTDSFDLFLAALATKWPCLRA